ncbi:hypothetical protein COLO4_22333 [Corchorus olitorius]|uniref:Uncharacterized protein n=1 Tax=Corchorus olitorius TaxID=93759 RepID=A0A1R3IMU0_9ROSI|nr:hypothetical protein COLO4_22333 [Corchorus olitorius]
MEATTTSFEMRREVAAAATVGLKMADERRRQGCKALER